jgi:hypothetical protein
MKTIIKLIILIAAVIWGLIATSCTRYCDPANIRSGKSNQHHDSKPFRAQIRIMWKEQYGPFCKVRYQNMKYSTNRIYEDCDCEKFKIGQWVGEDSI